MSAILEEKETFRKDIFKFKGTKKSKPWKTDVVIWQDKID